MKKIFALAFFCSCLVLFGCRKDNTTQPDTDFKSDAAFFKDIATNDQTYGDFAALDDNSGDDSIESLDDSAVTFAKLSYLQPLKFRKRITGVSKEFSVDTLGDSARILHIKKTISGSFIIIGIANDTDTVTVTKPFSQTGYRSIEFHRIAHSMRPRLNWIPYAITAGYGSTSMAQDSFAIKSLSLYFEGGDSLTITSPEDYWFIFGLNGGIPYCEKNKHVTARLTIESTSPDTEVAIVRVGRGRLLNYHRRHLLHLISQTQTGNVYTRVYEREYVSNHGIGRFNAHFEVMSHSTIFSDDVTKISSAFWAIPYKGKE